MTDPTQWLSGLPGCHDVKALTVTINKEGFVAAYYKQDLVAPDNCRKPGRYTREAVYCLGLLPKMYRRTPCLAFTLNGDTRDWYIACYYPAFRHGKPEPLKPEFAHAHPFGPSFILMPWDLNDGSKIDTGMPDPYTRLPITMERRVPCRPRMQPDRQASSP